MLNKLLHQSGKNIILNKNYEDMEDMLFDYKDFLTQDENLPPLEKKHTDIVVIIALIIGIIAPYYLTNIFNHSGNHYGLSADLMLYIQIIIGVIFPLLIFKLFNKKVDLLSSFYDITSSESKRVLILSILPIVSVGIYIALNMILSRETWYHVYQISVKSERFILIFTIIYTIYTLSKYLKTSKKYIVSFVMSFTSLIIALQVGVINRGMSTIEEYYSMYCYVALTLILSIILCVIFTRNSRKTSTEISAEISAETSTDISGEISEDDEVM